jgi:hypothetical protein
MRATVVALGLAALLVAAYPTAAHAFVPPTWIPTAPTLYDGPPLSVWPTGAPDGPYSPRAGRPLFCPPDGSFDVMGLVGKTEMLAAFQAAAHGCELRVAIRDGEHNWLTADLRESRVNVAVEDGSVVRIIELG